MVIGVLSVPKLQYIYCSEVKYIIVKVKKLSSVFIAGLQEQEGAAAASNEISYNSDRNICLVGGLTILIYVNVLPGDIVS